MAGQMTAPVAQAAEAQEFSVQRKTFRGLLALNPNYFGNLGESPFNPVQNIVGNTFYELLACVGYHPQRNRLEAVVHIYQPSGYGSGICGKGTPEYVRFYLSYNGGVDWKDVGLTGFRAHDVPAGTAGRKRLEYAVSLEVHPDQKYCSADPLILVRAILSWNHEPPANQPHWKPVWGNVRDAHIQVEPRRRFPIGHLFDIAKIKMPLAVEQLIDVNALIDGDVKALSLADKIEFYKDKGVEGHRIAHTEIHAALTGDAAMHPALGLHQTQLVQIDPNLKIDSSIFGKYFGNGDGNTDYEELTCIGLDPAAPDTLVGILKIKKKAGYSGGPCSQGSKEYVSFWADFDGNGGFETHLGTADVKAYDLPQLAADGAYYAVRLPVDLRERRKNCKDSPVVVRIRAILSWEVAPPANNPNYKPVWGNREEALIYIAPTDPNAPELGTNITAIGKIKVQGIGADGLTTASAEKNGGWFELVGAGRPFGGGLTVNGGTLGGTSYKVEVTRMSDGFTKILTEPLRLSPLFGDKYDHKADETTGRFSCVDWTLNTESVLALWPRSGTADDGVWKVTLTVYKVDKSIVAVAPGDIGAPDTHMIMLDNTAPVAKLEFDSFPECSKLTKGTPWGGKFTATDTHLAYYTLSVTPAEKVGAGALSPTSGSQNTAPGGDDWTLDTGKMEPCGYNIRLEVYDKSLVDDAETVNSASVLYGFSVVEAEQG